MSISQSASAEVFSLDEIARAAGAPIESVRGMAEAGSIVTVDGFVAADHAVRCVRGLRHRSGISRKPLFATPSQADRNDAAALTASGLLHAAFLVFAVFLGTLSVSSAPIDTPIRLDPTRLVFLATPGPGGGGGGGGMRQSKPPAKAELKGTLALKSPVPPPKPLTTRAPEPQRKLTPPVSQATTPPQEPPPPPPPATITPQVVAPVVTAAADAKDRAGVPTDLPPVAESQGSGSGGGVGNGQGTGIGEGTGPGIGPGSGGGTGGGPYRAGSGITPPDLLREVKPEYTDDARRRGIEGDVELEIVVRRDGSVGEVKVMRGLGGGLDRRAIDAVRQWRFAPARRFGSPVDVIVEVAVEFKLR